MLRRLSYWLVEHLGPLLLYAYFLTIRFRDNRRSELARRYSVGREFIFAFWHAHQLGALMMYRWAGTRILISQSKDGEYAARLAKGFGHCPERGSSSRGGIRGAFALIRAARAGHPVALTPDGPRGPRHSVQKGTLFIARRAARPIVPLAVGFSDYWELPSWDRFRIPKPFARGVALLGEPIPVSSDPSADSLPAVRERLRRALIDLEQDADRQARAWAGKRR